MEDLGSLAFDAGEGLLVPAAGAPWFMALFGRDALITGYQAMVLGPEPAKNALRALARYQATERDDLRDAEPGKIPHELRRGELAYFGEIPETPYYGTVDATPLFLVLLHEVWRWTADEEFVRELEGAARLALAWVLEHADRVGGYVAYASRASEGLQNQGWKNSEDSMLLHDGTRAAHRPLRGAGLRLRRLPEDRRARREGVGRRPPRRRAAAGGSGAQGALRAGLLDVGSRLLRPRPGRRGPEGGFGHLQPRPPPLERDRLAREGAARRGHLDGREALQRVGDKDDGRG